MKSSQKGSTLLIIIAVIVVVGLAIFFFNKEEPAPTPSQSSTEDVSQLPENPEDISDLESQLGSFDSSDPTAEFEAEMQADTK